MITNHDAAIIAEKDAKSLKWSESRKELGTWSWPIDAKGKEVHNGRKEAYAVYSGDNIVEVDHMGLENCAEYVKNNQYQYYLGINSWLHVIRAHNPIGADIIEDKIRANGFLPVIRSATEAAMQLIHGEAPETTWATVIRGCSMEDALIMLRFMKRFTPESRVFAKAKIMGFLDTIKDVKGVNSELRYSPVMSRIRYWVHYACARYDNSEVHTPIFTNGAVSHRNVRTLVEKLGDYYEENFGSPLYPNFHGWTNVHAENSSLDEPVSRFSAVPKDYKGYRGVAMEPTGRQVTQQAIREALEYSLYIQCGDNIPIRNQDVNGTLASRSDVATIDLSNASDSVSRRLCELLLPDSLYQDVITARSPKMAIPKYQMEVRRPRKGELDLSYPSPYNEYWLPMMSTMGNGYTFVLESCIFWAIAQTAVEYCSTFDSHKYYLRTLRRETGDRFAAWAYGDDIIVPDWAYETTIDLLEMCGFVVNRDKSYGSGLFKESCGHDWWIGEEVSSYYWPRKVIKPDLDSAPSLIALQNRLAERGSLLFYWDAMRFLDSQIRRISGKISRCTIDEVVEWELWGKVLVGPISEITHKQVNRDYGLRPGDGKSYSEDRLYVNAVVPKKWKDVTGCRAAEMGLYRSKTCITWDPIYWNIQMFLYAQFLDRGPLVLEEVPLNSGDRNSRDTVAITDSRFHSRISSYTDGFEVTRIRLI